MDNLIIFYLFLAVLNFFLATLSKDEIRFLSFVLGCGFLVRAVSYF